MARVIPTPAASFGELSTPEPGRTSITTTKWRQQPIRGTADEEFLLLARKRFRTVAESESTMRTEQLIDQRFCASEQWPVHVRAERDQDQRPCLTINRLPMFKAQVTNQQRASKPSIKINPVDSEADPKTAEVLQGLIRHIEINSGADIAYDTACDNQVTMGRGYIRLVVEWDEVETWKQTIRIKRVRNPFTVFFDPSCEEFDYSDARYCFVIEDIPKDEFVQQYGIDPRSAVDLFAMQQDRSADWMPEGRVRVAEYFYVETSQEEIALLSNGEEYPTSLLKGDEMQEWLSFADITVVRKRTRERRQVKWAKMTGSMILERQDWPGRWIPIVPVLGVEVDINGQVDLRGMIRDARDPQRMYNYWVDLHTATQIPTPSGWSTMEKLKVGDQVLDNKGKPCNVIGKSPIYVNKDCFRVTFDDGSNIVASADHRWTVEERGKRQNPTWEWTTKTVTTRDLVPKKHFIWATKPLQLPDADLPIGPYTLGLWLSDGNSSGGVINQKATEIPALQATMAAAGERFGHVGIDGAGHGRFRVDGLTGKLRAAGLLNNKHIPAVYLRASLKQRLALLQGLMDGDGSVAKTSRQCEFSTGSVALRAGVSELLRTLGIKAKHVTRPPRTSTLADGQKLIGREPVYQFSFSAPPPEAMPVFSLARKFEGQKAKNGKYHPRRTDRWSIVSVEPVESVNTQCIGVDSPDHLYLAGPSMVPTHNSAETETIALAPRSPFLVAEGQIEGHEAQWKLANRRNFPYLQYKPKSLDQTLVPAPQRQTMEPPIAAIVAATQQADNDLKAVTGFYDASLGERGPEQSGRAILARQQQGDVSNSHWIDNLVRAMRSIGKQLIDLIPRIYDTPRVVRILGLDQQYQTVVVHAGAPEEQLSSLDAGLKEGVTGIYDLSVGTYDVVVSVGPNERSRRAEAVEAMTAFVQAFPQAAPVIGDVLAEAMDWPGATVIAKRLRKMVPPNLLDTEAVSPEQQAAQIQQLEQQVQGLQASLQQAAEMIRTKQVENQSREKIATENNQTKLQIAEMQAQLEQMTTQIAARQGELKLQADAHKAQTDMQRGEIDLQVAHLNAQGQQKTLELDHIKTLADVHKSQADAESKRSASDVARAGLDLSSYQTQVEAQTQVSLQERQQQHERQLLHDEQRFEAEQAAADREHETKVEKHRAATTKAVAAKRTSQAARAKKPGGKA